MPASTPQSVDMETLRRVAVRAARLARTAGFGRGTPAARRALQHLGHVQIDTISVVARAHEHILAARVPGAGADDLQTLVARREAFEYWAHAAAYLPISDYRHTLPRMHRMAARARHHAPAQKREKKRVLDRIRAEGAMRARDFAAPPGRRGGWWDWKPAKLALEQLFHEGRIMVAAREGFQKRFDLAERVLPDGTDTRRPSLEEHAAWLVARARQSLGVFTARHAYYQRREAGLGRAVTDAVDAAVERGELTLVANPSLPQSPRWYANTAALEDAARPVTRRARALSPFDPLVIHRDRLRAIFGFDYQLECYVPAPRRQYGYFALPLLHGTRFLGRADCKADRRASTLRCLRLSMEPACNTTTGRSQAREALEALARTVGCEWHGRETNNCRLPRRSEAVRPPRPPRRV
ncbi:MAG: YcaQ family DNA glycosylase [Opitutales bacterium]|nr:YcaQ family DNA glycosylase [Opitutales bacterium]